MISASNQKNILKLHHDLTPITDPLFLKAQKGISKISQYIDSLIGLRTLKVVLACRKIRAININKIGPLLDCLKKAKSQLKLPVQ
jgi:hypothetical protein